MWAVGIGGSVQSLEPRLSQEGKLQSQQQAWPRLRGAPRMETRAAYVSGKREVFGGGTHQE